jgi:hypothetical protein
MSEKRISPRRRVLKAGTIESDSGVIDCMVRNLSTTGAALEVTRSIGIPERFTLMADGLRQSCHVVWRKEKRIGIAFD